MSAPQLPPPPSRMPAGYDFVRVLGSGGNGWVALAVQPVLGRQVAIKTIYGGHHDVEGRRRLEREGQALARLQHARIVKVYELVDSTEDLMLVMEYVDGTDLSAGLPQLDGAARLRVLSDIAQALEHAAAAGVVHRDVKPPNVLLDRAGGAKLTDFGIARISRSAAAFRTGGSAASGTARYVAPEQLTDPDHEASSADAYSFSVMAYEMVVGRSPFHAETTEAMIYAHLSAAPLPPRGFNPAVSDAAAQALLCGLSKNPAERPTPAELVARLDTDPQRWPVASNTAPGDALPVARAPVTYAPTPSPSVPWTEPTAMYRPERRRTIAPFLIGAAGALIVILVLLAAWSLWR